MISKKPLHSVRKFYFLDYFYILLRSVEKQSRRDDIFASFKMLKQKHRLGESKYKRLTDDGEVLTPTQQHRYNYTFKQVVEESREYKLVSQGEENTLKLTDKGKTILQIHDEQGFEAFLHALATLMEEHFGAFRILVEFMYQTNPRRSGVLIFPHYSPLELDFRRQNIQTTADIQRYAGKLAKQLERDIQKYLNRTISLTVPNEEILDRLVNDEILPAAGDALFLARDYNKITKRIRDFWITYFLRTLYESPLTMSTFDLWVYRAKQVGVIHATEFHPFTNGKLVYPTAVVLPRAASADFRSIYNYDDGNHLYLHEPDVDKFQETFVDELVKGYFKLRGVSRNYFINLASLREAVCYALKISSTTFENFLNEVYRLNLQGELQISISLEVDKLPEETNAMYLKREPVMVDGRYRNIIAIDITNGGKSK